MEGVLRADIRVGSSLIGGECSGKPGLASSRVETLLRIVAGSDQVRDMSSFAAIQLLPAVAPAATGMAVAGSNNNRANNNANGWRTRA